MALFKKIAAPGKYHDPEAIPNLIAYITRVDKTPSRIIYGSHVDMQDMANSMISVSEQFGKNSQLRLHHFIVTFQTKDMLKELLAQYQGLNSIEPINTLLSQHIAKWIEHDRPHITVTTYNQYTWTLYVWTNWVCCYNPTL